MSLTVILPLDLGTGMRVVPESDTAILYWVHPESIDKYNESGHASHDHLISMYSHSEADFLSVERLSLLFIGWYSCLPYISANPLPNQIMIPS